MPMMALVQNADALRAVMAVMASSSVSKYGRKCRHRDAQYRFTGGIQSVVNCCCNKCRTLNGSAFSA